MVKLASVLFGLLIFGVSLAAASRHENSDLLWLAWTAVTVILIFLAVGDAAAAEEQPTPPPGDLRHHTRAMTQFCTWWAENATALYELTELLEADPVYFIAQQSWMASYAFLEDIPEEWPTSHCEEKRCPDE